MAKLDIFNVLGTKVADLEVSDAVFNVEPHNQAMFDLVLAERASLRQGTHQTKNRSAVKGGGRKPWKQKGTGRARQGSIRSPQWKGGGVVFGPQSERNYTLKINRKIRKLALRSGWTIKFAKKQIYVLDDITFQKPVTKDFVKMLDNLKLKNVKVLLLLNSEEKEFNTYLAARNIENVLIYRPETVMLDDLLKAQAIVTREETLKAIEGGLK